MNLDKRHIRHAEARGNVADQPGAVIFWSGVIVSLILGLLLRGALHPQIVRQKIEQAAKQIHPSLRVDFEKAFVSLSDGGIPGFSVVIQRIKMTSDNPCWMGPRLIADEIRLPLSVRGLMLDGTPFRWIEAGDVELRLTMARPNQDCEVTAESRGAEQIEAQRTIRIVRTHGGTLPKSRERTGDVDGLSIRRLVLASEVAPRATLNLENLEFLTRSSKPLILSLSSELLIHRPVSRQEATPWRTSLQVEYKEFPEKMVDLRLEGQLREGTYLLEGEYSLDREDLRLKADLSHVPLNELFEVLKTRESGLPSIKPRLSWLFLKASMQGPIKNIAQTPVEISDFRIDGDLGDISTSRIQILTLKPFRIAPAHFEVKSLNWDQLLDFIGYPHPTPMVHRLGAFSGDLHLVDEANFELKGLQRDLELIFSSQGRRELQKISSVASLISRDKGAWRVQLSDAEMDGGRWRGQMDLRMDSASTKSRVDFIFDELELHPLVRSLMTLGGDLTPLQGRLTAHFQGSHLESLAGDVKIAEMKIGGAELKELSLQLLSRGEEIEARSKLQGASIPLDGLAKLGLKDLFPVSWSEQNQLLLTGLEGRIQYLPTSEIRWDRVMAKSRLSSGAVLRTRGGWNGAGELYGQAQVGDSRNGFLSFVVEGTRDLPVVRRSTP